MDKMKMTKLFLPENAAGLIDNTRQKTLLDVRVAERIARIIIPPDQLAWDANRETARGYLRHVWKFMLPSIQDPETRRVRTRYGWIQGEAHLLKHLLWEAQQRLIEIRADSQGQRQQLSPEIEQLDELQCRWEDFWCEGVTEK